MKIYLIRHGRTRGNEEGRYAGATDHTLSPAGEADCRAHAAQAPLVQQVYASPMQRCMQTAGILFPTQPPMLIQGLRECNFGEFENKNHEELKHLPAYNAFLASPTTATAPGGESWQSFSDRCCEAFVMVTEEAMAQALTSIAIVTHGGVIMTILERFGTPNRNMYDWIVENIGGWQVTLDPVRWAKDRTVDAVAHLNGDAVDA